MTHFFIKNELLPVLSVVFSAAIFGFFYAWICSTMWGLDASDPRVAIKAMQVMNASVRNPVFALSFFGTPVVLIATSLILFRNGRKNPSGYFLLAALIYLAGSFLPTAAINVPLNEGLALVEDMLSHDEARIIWSQYSQPWQFWNQIRTFAAGVSLILVIKGLLTLNKTN